MYAIEVVNVHFDRSAEYIGRPSALGNPIPISKHKPRFMVCDEYEDYFKERLHSNDLLMLTELRRLHRLGKKTGKIKLGCHCKQKHKEVRCHGDTIKAWMEDNFEYLEMLEEMSGQQLQSQFA